MNQPPSPPRAASGERPGQAGIPSRRVRQGRRRAAVRFQPLPLLTNPHLQTLLSHLLVGASEPPSQTVRVPLPGGDQLALEVSTPSAWEPPDGTVVMVHGFTGSHRSGYLVRLAERLHQRGVRAVRLNLRGCGSGVGLSRLPYHAGCSDDVRRALELLQARDPGPPPALVGFSLGGNIALKLAGELAQDGPALLRQVIAVCPPVDLQACWQRMASAQTLYQRVFLRWVREQLDENYACFPDLPRPELPAGLTLRELDEVYTAPQWGFASADDYYRQASAAPVLAHVAVPTRILFAEDDPIVDPDAIERVPLSRHIRVLRVARGGHMGFLALPVRRRGYRWLDAALLKWLDRGASERLPRVSD